MTRPVPWNVQRNMTRMSRLAPSWLIALLLVIFAFSTDDYVIIGILPAVAKGLHTNEVAAGQLVTAFSLTYAIGVPFMTVFTSSWPRKRLIMAGLGTFIGANICAAVSASYPEMLIVRMVAAMSVAATMPVVFSIAGALAPPQKQTRYLATVGIGLTAALVIGVPMGSWVSVVAGWRAAFLVVSSISVIAMLVLWRALPHFSTVQPRQLAKRLAPLAQPAVALCLGGIVIVVLSNMTIMTYLAPFTHDISGVGARGLGVFLVLGGIAGIVGGQFSGKIAESHNANTAMTLVVTIFISAMAALVVLWRFRELPAVAIAPVVMIWYLAAWGVPPAAQTKMLTYASSATDQAIALTSTAVSVGAAGGGAVGGAILGRTGTGGLPLVAAILAGISLLLFWLAQTWWHKSPAVREQP